VWKCPYAKEGMRCVHYTFDDRPGYLAAHFRTDHLDLFTDVEDGMPRVNCSVAMAKAHLNHVTPSVHAEAAAAGDKQ
jgi:peptide methionine sulfoxide reductase MsrB